MLPRPVLENVEGFLVVRDDLLPGGTKMRAIMPLLADDPAFEFVYASPAQGYAQLALAHCSRILGRKATIFTAKRKHPHRLTIASRRAGASVVMIPHGYLSNVQSKARAYAREVGASLIPFGCNDERSVNGIAQAAVTIDEPEEVWTVAGSGVLTRALQRAWPRAKFFAVLVGKKSSDTGRAERIYCPLAFEKDASILPPFPSASNYDAKAWGYMLNRAKKGALFWNVGA